MIHLRTKYTVGSKAKNEVQHHNCRAQNNFVRASSDLAQADPTIFHLANERAIRDLNSGNVSLAY